uniref:Uncharacterized protein n=1 Tax=Picea sitchensis TaxID=3332 RepID=A9NLA4_PICSI|nr:unknown [Picea sitchensis]ABK25114.1 unknown [Picea sitchensis]
MDCYSFCCFLFRLENLNCYEIQVFTCIFFGCRYVIGL